MSLSQSQKDDRAIVVCFTLLCAVVILVALWFQEAKCESRWAYSGMKTDWGPIKGCLVQRRDGTWVPEEVYREIME